MGKITNIVSHALVALVAYIAPLGEVFWCMLLFVFADLLTGVYASRINHVATNSRRLRKSVVKLICYIGSMFLAFVAERSFGVEFGSHKMVGGFICLVEFMSILENMATITGKEIFLNIIKLIRGSKGDVIKEILDEKNEKNG